MSTQAADSDPNTGSALLTTISTSTPDPLVSDWLVKAMFLGSNVPGFISGEVVPPKNAADTDWKLTQRFREPTQAAAWQQSEAHTKFLAELAAAFPNKGLQVTEVDRGNDESTVTTAIMTHVKPGMEKAYRDWECRVQAAQAKSPGFKGAYFQPDTGESGVWVSLMRFDTSESLDRWFESPERKELLEDARQLVTSTDIQRVTGSFPGWIPVDEKTGKAPPNWKAFLLVLLGLYPIVSMEIRFLMPMLSHVPTAAANLLGNSISVAGTTWLTMPLFIKWFAPWLFPSADSKPADGMKWLALLIALFGLELLVLWHLLPTV